MSQEDRTEVLFDRFDKSLPYLFVIAGVLMIAHFEADLCYHPGLIFILLGGVVVLIRIALSKIEI